MEERNSKNRANVLPEIDSAKPNVLSRKDIYPTGWYAYGSVNGVAIRCDHLG
jgi:hypothetical protein